MTNKTITLSRERQAFEALVQKKSERFQPYFIRFSDHPEADYKDGTLQWAWELWQARSALAEPVSPDGGEVEVLELLAKAATPGPWGVANKRYGGVIRGGPMQTFTNGSAQSQIVMCCGAEWMEPGQLERNAEYIAAANPSAILALLDDHRTHVTRLQAEVSHLRQHKNDYMEAAEETRKALQAEVERLKEVAIARKDELTKRCTERNDLQSELTSANADKAAYGKNAVDLRLRVDALQAELTKARELLADFAQWYDEPRLARPAVQIRRDIDSFLSNQSAPTDKGHGEPVAYILAKQTSVEVPGQERKELGYTLLDGLGVFRSRDEVHAAIAELGLPLGWVSMTVDQLLPGYMESAYAEQPAPVAVVMPERRIPPPLGPDFYARGWNACLDEVARLNGIKP
jgi:hypothetical protein